MSESSAAAQAAAHYTIENFRPTDEWGVVSASASFIASHLAGKLITPSLVEQQVGRRPGEADDPVEVNHWLLNQGRKLEAYYAFSMEDYLEGKSTFEELLEAHATAFGITIAEANRQINKDHLDRYKPTHAANKKRFEPYIRSGQLVEHDTMANPLIVAAAVRAGKMALISGHARPSLKGVMAPQRVAFQPLDGPVQVYRPVISGELVRPAESTMLQTWVDYSNPVLLVS